MAKSRQGKSPESPKQAWLDRSHSDKIEWIRIDALKLLNNPKIHPAEQVTDMEQSILQYGFTDPCLVSQADNTLLAGYCRMTAAKNLGWEKVPCRLVTFSPEEYFSYIVSEGRIAEKGSWDYEVFIQWYKEAPEASKELIIGWSEDDILKISKWQDEHMATLPSGMDTSIPPDTSFEPPQESHVEYVVTIPVRVWEKDRGNIENVLTGLVDDFPAIKLTYPKLKRKKS